MSTFSIFITLILVVCSFSYWLSWFKTQKVEDFHLLWRRWAATRWCSKNDRFPRSQYLDLGNIITCTVLLSNFGLDTGNTPVAGESKLIDAATEQTIPETIPEVIPEEIPETQQIAHWNNKEKIREMPVS